MDLKKRLYGRGGFLVVFFVMLGFPCSGYSGWDDVAQATASRIANDVVIQDEPELYFSGCHENPAHTALERALTSEQDRSQRLRIVCKKPEKRHLILVMNPVFRQNQWWQCPFRIYEMAVTVKDFNEKTLFSDKKVYLERDTAYGQWLGRILAVVLAYFLIRGLLRMANFHRNRVAVTCGIFFWMGLALFLGWGCLATVL